MVHRFSARVWRVTHLQGVAAMAKLFDLKRRPLGVVMEEHKNLSAKKSDKMTDATADN